MPSSTYTRQMSKNSKIYKINNVNTLPSKKYMNGPKSPTPNSEEAPPAKCPKGHPNEKRVQGKGPVNSSRESRPHHRKIMHVRKGPKGNTKSNQASITRQQTLIKGNYSGDDDSSKSKTPEPPPTHNGPHSETPT